MVQCSAFMLAGTLKCLDAIDFQVACSFVYVCEKL